MEYVLLLIAGSLPFVLAYTLYLLYRWADKHHKQYLRQRWEVSERKLEYDPSIPASLWELLWLLIPIVFMILIFLSEIGLAIGSWF